MDYMKLVERHIETQADLTIGGLRVDVRRRPRSSASCRSTPRTAWSVSRRSRRTPKPIPGDPEHALASMGIYVFNARFLFEQLCLDATRHGSKHDFGRDVIPGGDPHAQGVRLSVPGREPQEGRLLAGRGHAGRLLRGEHGPGGRRSAA